MSGKTDAPPAYAPSPAQSGPAAPAQAHYGDYQQSYPPQQQQGGYPPQGYPQGEYQQNPQMGYYGGQPGYPPQGQYPHQGQYPPQQPGYYQNQNQQRQGPGLLEGLMAGLCCCCCLDAIF